MYHGVGAARAHHVPKSGAYHFLFNLAMRCSAGDVLIKQAKHRGLVVLFSASFSQHGIHA